MKPIKLTIKTKSEKYPILIGSNLLTQTSKILKKNLADFNNCLLVIDKKVPTKMTNKIIKSIKKKKIFQFSFNANEKNKNQKIVNDLIDILLKKNFSRNDCLIAIGGGITGDVAGFAASIFKRGIQFVNIPTTLLAQVDSSIGGKTGVNTQYGKNLIGSFYQPKLVISDSQFLNTLSTREIVCGYGEILKHSLIMNKKFYNFLNKNVLKIIKLKSPFIETAIYESCKIKKYVVERDENEKGRRKVLNLGHTFAHAYEATLGFSKKLNHGEAVILGIQSALRFSLKRKKFKEKEYKSIINHISQAGLPSKISKYFSTKNLSKIIYFMTKDKKNYSNKINLILLRNIGTPEINDQFNINALKSFMKSELKN